MRANGGVVVVEGPEGVHIVGTGKFGSVGTKGNGGKLGRPVDGVSGGSVGNGGKLGRPVDGVSGGSVGNGGKLGRPVDGVSGGSVGNGGKPTGRPGNDGVGKPGRPGKNKRWRAAVGWRFPEKTRAEMREKMMRVVVEAI
ncbi:hypothetical protein Tco_0221224 [Tanacetum coccineum]